MCGAKGERRSFVNITKGTPLPVATLDQWLGIVPYMNRMVENTPLKGKQCRSCRVDFPTRVLFTRGCFVGPTRDTIYEGVMT